MYYNGHKNITRGELEEEDEELHVWNDEFEIYGPELTSIIRHV